MITNFLRRGLLATLAVLVVSGAASAQDGEAPAGDLSVGYSFLSVDAGPFRDRGDVHGFNVTGAGHFNDWFGIAGEASGHYESGDALHYVMAGPRFTYRGASRVEPYAHVMAGGAFLNSSGRFAAQVGGGLDVKVSDKVAIRAVQVDYAPIFFNGNAAHNVKVSAGVSFRF
jgi:hypothetical protein